MPVRFLCFTIQFVIKKERKEREEAGENRGEAGENRRKEGKKKEKEKEERGKKGEREWGRHRD